MMKALSDREWNAVSLDTIFTFERGKEKNMAALIEGSIPLVSAKKVNNGIKGFVKNPAKIIKGGNVLSLNNDGDGGAGLAYYQPVDFALDTHVTALHPKQNISPNALLYMTASISKQHSVFGHGRSISLPRARHIQDMLPVTDGGNPDYDYMSEYVREHKEAMLAKYRDYAEKRIVEIGESVDIPALDEKEWVPVSIIELFSELTPGKISNASAYVKSEVGNVEYVAATSKNNGCLYFFEDADELNKKVQKGNCVGFIKDGDGSAGYAIYKKEDFVSTVNVIYGYSDWLNSFTGLFFVAAQDKIEDKYGHGYKRNKQHLRGDKVMLPINDSGKPDFEYMEQYAKNTILRKYKQYLVFSENQKGDGALCRRRTDLDVTSTCS